MAIDDSKKIDDIVSMLDEFMSQNGGHMNIHVSDDGTVSTDRTMAKKVTTMNSSDCASGNLACNIPTLFKGMDFEIFEEENAEEQEGSESEHDDSY